MYLPFVDQISMSFKKTQGASGLQQICGKIHAKSSSCRYSKHMHTSEALLMPNKHTKV